LKDFSQFVAMVRGGRRIHLPELWCLGQSVSPTGSVLGVWTKRAEGERRAARARRGRELNWGGKRQRLAQSKTLRSRDGSSERHGIQPVHHEVMRIETGERGPRASCLGYR